VLEHLCVPKIPIGSMIFCAFSVLIVFTAAVSRTVSRKSRRLRRGVIVGSSLDGCASERNNED
jgi:hypothetical protein